MVSDFMWIMTAIFAVNPPYSFAIARSIREHQSMAREGTVLQALGSAHQCRSDFIPILQCPAFSDHHSPFYHNEFLGKRSTCPWVMCRDSDPYRHPRDIYYAKCLCTGCKGQSGEYSCQPIFTSRIVSRVTDISNFEEIVRVPVGCTCAKNR